MEEGNELKSAITEPPELKPSPLYKYVDIVGLKRILQGAVRFTQPRAFNDPFELLPEIVTPNGEAERHISIKFDVTAQRRQPPPGEVDVVPDGHGTSDATSRDIVQHLNDQVGILCLSRTKESLLMWAHYADQYAGAVIEFDASHDFFAGQIDMEYRSSRPKRHLSAYLDGDNPVPVAELCVKSEQWACEREVRIIRCLSDCERVGEDGRGFPVYIQRIPLAAIKQIILGERTNVIEQREIYRSIKETRIALSLAAIDHWGYAFRHEQIKSAVLGSQMGPAISPRTAHIFSDEQSPLGEIARRLIETHPMSRLVNRRV